MASIRGGGGGDEIFSIIRDCRAEHSHGERRLSDLKKRSSLLQAETAAANAELDTAKRAREDAEKDLKASQLQLSITDATLLAQQARITLLQEEIAAVRANVTAVKAAEDSERDEFISAMLLQQEEIRQFRVKLPAFWKQYDLDPPSDNDSGCWHYGVKFWHLFISAICISCQRASTEVLNEQADWKCLEDQIMSMNANLHKEEEEYKNNVHDLDETHRMLASEEHRAFLLEAVMEETKQLQELASQTSGLEKTYATHTEELRKSYICPRCQLSNMGDMEETTEPEA